MSMVIKLYIEDKLKKLGFTSITPIQEGVFARIDSPKHLVGLSPTGTGKTHAYLLPILSKLKKTVMEVQFVVVVPTNELVYQVESMLKAVDDTFKVKAYVGGSDKHRELEWLAKFQPQIVISTPNRLAEFVVEMNALKIQSARYFVLDEADMMFDYDFLSLIDQVLPSMPNAKYLLFSASIHQGMDPFIRKYFGAYDLIDTTKKHHLNIEYALINIKYQDRLQALEQLVKLINPYLCFIFVSKKENQEVVFKHMEQMGLNVVNINATLGVKKRAKIIEDIKNLRYVYVVTSDLAARGLDFKISHVIQYDLPHHLEFFMHRSGRTGRMNDTGIVYTFMTVDDHRKIDRLKALGIPFRSYAMSSEGLKKVPVRKTTMSQEETDAIKKIKKPTRVVPNYKKKNAKLIKKAKQELRNQHYAATR